MPNDPPPDQGSAPAVLGTQPSVDLAELEKAPRGVYTTNALKRQFSETLAQAMAAVLNVQCTVHPSGDDIDSIDLEYNTGRFGPKGVYLGLARRLEVQLKCTTAAQLKRMPHPTTGVDSLRYYLSVADYNRLAIPQNQRTYPHVLVVVRVPPAPSDWMHFQGPLTLLRARAWWLDLTNAQAPANKKNEPVYLPYAQRFDVHTLDGLMAEPQ